MSDIALTTNLVVAGFAFPDNDLPIFTSHAWTDYVAAWHNAEASVTEERWRQAAIAASIETHYGQGSVERFAQEVGCHPQRIYEYRAAYRLAVAFKERFAERPANLEFSHFVVAAQSPKPIEILDRAVEETMTVRQMRRAIAEVVAAPLSASLAPVGIDERIPRLWDAYQAAGRALAAVVPLASNAITYAEEEVRYILEIPEQSVQERILYAIREDGRNEVDTIAQGIGANRDHVLVWLNRMVELDILAAERQHTGQRGPVRTYFSVKGEQ